MQKKGKITLDGQIIADVYFSSIYNCEEVLPRNDVNDLDWLEIKNYCKQFGAEISLAPPNKAKESALPIDKKTLKK